MTEQRQVPEARAGLVPEATLTGSVLSNCQVCNPNPRVQEETKLQGQLETGPGRADIDKLWGHTVLATSPAFATSQLCARDPAKGFLESDPN